MVTQVPVPETFHRVNVRCRVCRRRDFENGGSGRADRVAVVDFSPDLSEERSRVKVRYWQPNSKDKIPKSEDGGELRTKCRRGHRVNKSSSDLMVEAAGAIASGRNEVFV